VKFIIEIMKDYWQVKSANDQMLDLAIYQSYTYNRSCVLISSILRQVMEQMEQQVSRRQDQ